MPASDERTLCPSCGRDRWVAIDGIDYGGLAFQSKPNWAWYVNRHGAAALPATRNTGRVWYVAVFGCLHCGEVVT